MPTKPKRHKPTSAPPTTVVERRRASAAQHGREWRRISKARLARYPLCADPFGVHAARNTEAPATDVDHIVPLARGGTHAASNLQSVCHSCHSRITALCDGGFGRAERNKHVRGSDARECAARHITQPNNVTGEAGPVESLLPAR